MIHSFFLELGLLEASGEEASLFLVVVHVARGLPVGPHRLHGNLVQKEVEDAVGDRGGNVLLTLEGDAAVHDPLDVEEAEELDAAVDGAEEAKALVGGGDLGAGEHTLVLGG